MLSPTNPSFSKEKGSGFLQTIFHFLFPKGKPSSGAAETTSSAQNLPGPFSIEPLAFLI